MSEPIVFISRMLAATLFDHQLAGLDEHAGRQKRGPDGPPG
jgi:hypothetical protein